MCCRQGLTALSRTSTDNRGASFFLPLLPKKCTIEPSDHLMRCHQHHPIMNYDPMVCRCPQDELTRLKNIDQENKKEMEDLRKINTELQGTIKNLSLKLEEEHHASDSAQREAKAQFQQLEVQIRQHQIANEALQEKLGQVTEAFTKETMELKDKCQRWAWLFTMCCKGMTENVGRIQNWVLWWGGGGGGALMILEFSLTTVTSLWWWKGFTETGHTITDDLWSDVWLSILLLELY